MDTVVTALAPVAGWWLNLLITHGPLKVTAAAAVVIAGIWCGLGIALHAYEQTRARRGKETP